MPLGYNNDDGAQALDQQQEIDYRRGWQVVNASGGSNLVTDGTGSYEVDVAAGDINTPTGTVTCSAATLDLQSLVDPDLPRIVLVYRDASGVAQTLAGTPAAKQPTGETAPGPIFQPAPDAFSTTDGVVLATVLLEAAASSVGAGQIRDRRMPASLNVDSAEVGSLSTEGAYIETGSVTNNTYLQSQTRVPTTGRDHRGWQGICHHPSSNTLFVVYRESDNHGTDNRSTVRVIESPDRGRTWKNDRELLDNAIDVRPHQSITMPDGRMIIQCDRRDANDDWSDEVGLLISDDGGSTWTLETISNSAGIESPTPRLYPSDMGGDDSEGLILIGSDKEDGTYGDIYAFTSTDNGDTFSKHNVLSKPSGVDLAEPSYVRLGDTDEYIMVIRDEAGGPSQVTKSDDLLNWPQPQDMGINFGKNRPYIHSEGGYIHLHAASRAFSSKEVGSFGDGLLYSRGLISELRDDVTAWEGFTKLAEGGHPEGYWTHTSGASDAQIFCATTGYGHGYYLADVTVYYPYSISEDFADGPAGNVRGLSSNQSIPNDTWTTVEFDRVIDDDFGEWESLSHEINPRQLGTLNVDASVRWSQDTEWSTGDKIEIGLRFSESFSPDQSLTLVRRKIGTDDQDMMLSTQVDVTEVSNISIAVRQDSGASKELVDSDFATVLTWSLDSR